MYLYRSSARWADSHNARRLKDLTRSINLTSNEQSRSKTARPEQSDASTASRDRTFDGGVSMSLASEVNSHLVAMPERSTESTLSSIDLEHIF